MGDDQNKPTDTGLPAGDTGTTVPPVTDPTSAPVVVPTPGPGVPTDGAGTPVMPGTEPEPTPAVPAEGGTPPTDGAGTPPATV